MMALTRRLGADRLAGAAITLLGVWFLWQAFGMPERPGAGAVGPRVFPIIVGLGILASGIALLLSRPERDEGCARSDEAESHTDGDVAGAESLAETRDATAEQLAERGALPVAGDPVKSQVRADQATLGGIAALLAVYLAAFLPLGFPIASALFLAAAARVLGSRAWLRDLVAGVVVSAAAFVVFTRLLGLELPTGPLEAPLQALFGGSLTE